MCADLAMGKPAPRRTQTFVKATCGPHEVKGKSGNGYYVNNVLSQTYKNNILVFYEQVFKYVKQAKSVTWGPADCAEAHAVAQLLAKGCAYGDIEVGVAADRFSDDKAECPNCSQWIANGSIINLSPEKAHGSKVTLGDFISTKLPSSPAQTAAKPSAWGPVGTTPDWVTKHN